MLDKNFKEFIALLEKKRVKYLVIGGYAVGIHGFPRYTEDLDIFIALSPQNAAKMPSVFEEFGFKNLAISKDDFLKKDYVVEVGREPLKIQILTGIDGVTFNECYRNKVFIVDDRQVIPFIGIAELLKNKKASPRAKDKIDLAELKRVIKNQEKACGLEVERAMALHKAGQNPLVDGDQLMRKARKRIEGKHSKKKQSSND